MIVIVVKQRGSEFDLIGPYRSADKAFTDGEKWFPKKSRVVWFVQRLEKGLPPWLAAKQP